MRSYIATLLLFFAVAYISAAKPQKLSLTRSVTQDAPVVKPNQDAPVVKPKQPPLYHHTTKPIDLQATAPPSVTTVVHDDVVIEKVVGPVIIDEVPIHHEHEEHDEHENDKIGEVVFGEEPIGVVIKPTIADTLGTTVPGTTPPPAVEGGAD